MPYGPPQILSYTSLMKPVETIKTGIPNVLPPEFFSVTEEVLGNTAEVVELPGTRRVARVAPYGAPPRQVEHVPLAVRPLVLLHTIEEIAFRDELFRYLRQWDRYEPMQDRAKDEIARQGKQFVTRQDNLEVAVITSFLAGGKAWFDGDGNLLPSATGAKLTIDQGIPANNQGQLNGTVATTWATAGTDIVSDITSIKQLAFQTTGHPLRFAFYGKNIPGYFAKNDTIKPFWQFNQSFNESWLGSGKMPKDMLELVWIPAYPTFYEDQTGTIQSQFPADQVTFTPDINADTYAFLKGSYPVPKAFGPVMLTGDDGAGAKDLFADVFGRFRYAFARIHPSGILDVTGNTFMPRFKIPASIFQLDCTP